MGGQIAVIVSVALVAGMAGGLLSGLLRHARGAAGRLPGMIRATNIALVDDVGRERAVLKLVDGRPMLVLSDEFKLPSGDKVLVARLAVGILGDGAPGLEIVDSDGKKRAVLSLAADGVSALEVTARNNKAAITLSVTADGAAALMSLDDRGNRVVKWP